MIIDLNCPIELRSYEMQDDDNGSIRAYVSLYNLDEKTITGYKATVRWYNGLKREEYSENITVDSLNVSGRTEFNFLLSGANVKNADHIEMFFSEVTFKNEIWKVDNAELVDIGEQQLLAGDELDFLRSIAGDDCVQYPQAQSKYWRCVCGRINTLTSESCKRCGRDRGEVLTKLNAKVMHALYRGEEPACSVRARTRKELRKENEEKRRFTGKNILLAVLLFAALLCMCIFGILGFFKLG